MNLRRGHTSWHANYCCHFLFRSCLGDYIVAIAWVQLPCQMKKTLSHSRCQDPLAFYNLFTPSFMMFPTGAVL